MSILIALTRKDDHHELGLTIRLYSLRSPN